MRRFAVCLAASGMAMGWALAAGAWAMTTEDILAGMAKRVGEARTYEFDTRTEWKGVAAGKSVVGHACLQSVEKGGKRALSLMNIRQEMIAGGIAHDVLTVHDGKSVWNQTKDPMTNRVTAVKSKPDASAALKDPTQLADHYELKYIGDEDFDGQKMWVLEGAPKAKAGAPEVAKVRISVGQNDSFVHRWITYAKDGSETSETQLTNLKFNTKLDPALFTYTPPPGAKVVDATR